MLRIILIMFMSITVACSNTATNSNSSVGGSSGGDNNSGGGNQPEPTVLPFAISPDNFSFPRTELGAISVASVKITNTSSKDIFFKNEQFKSPITTTNQSLSTACNSTENFVKLSPNKSCFIDAVFQPKIDSFMRESLKVLYYTESESNQIQYNIDYSTRSLSAIGNEVVIATPDYLTFTNSVEGVNVKSFNVFNNSNLSYTLSGKINSTANIYLIESSSTCVGILQPNARCRFDIKFNLPTGADSRVYEDNLTISAVNLTTGKGVSFKKPIIGNKKNDDIVSLAFDSYIFNPTKANYIDFDSKSVTLLSAEKITSLSKTFISSSGINFNSSPFDIDFVNCRAGVEAGNSCEVVLKFKPVFAIQSEAIGKISAYGISGKTYDTYIHLKGTGVEDLSSDTTISGLEVSKLISNLITEAGSFITDTILFKNIGSSSLALQFNQLNSREFKISGCVGVILTMGDSCTATITFSPKSVGSFEDTVTVSAVGVTDSVQLRLSGIATAPTQSLDKITYSTKLLNFGSVETGRVSSKLSIQLTAKANLTSLSYELSNDSNFIIDSNSCGKVLNQSASCLIVLSFSPTAELNYKAVLKVTNDNSADIIELQGIGTKSSAPININGLYLSTKSLPFANTFINEFSSKKEVEVKNISDVDIPLSYTTREASNATMFNLLSDCSYLLKANTSCKITVFFMPIDAINYTDEIIIKSGVIEDRIILNGNGLAVSTSDKFDTLIDDLMINKKRLDFIKTEVGTRSVVATVELIYNANAKDNLTYEIVNSQPHIFQIEPQNTTCNFLFLGKQPTEQRCTISFVFTPQSGFEYADILSVNDLKSSGKKATVKLYGRGIEFIKSDNFGVVTIGSTPKTRRVLFVNDTDFAYDLTDVSITTRVADGLNNILGNNGFSILSTACKNIKLLPGRSCETIVVFDPKVDALSGAGYQGRLIISSTDNDFNIQLLGASKSNTLLKLEKWVSGEPTFGWGTNLTAINNKIYSIGNEFVAGHKQLREYSTATNRWRVINPLGVSPFFDISKIFPIGREDDRPKCATEDYHYVSHSAILSSGDKFYIFGGWFNPQDSAFSGGFSSNILSYYDQADTRLNKDGSWSKLLSLPTSLFTNPGRHGQSIALINNRIYAYSGRDIGSNAEPDFLIYDIPRSTWSDITASVSGIKPTPAAFTAVVGYNGKLYVDGGFNGTTILNEFWIFDTTKTSTSNPNGEWFKVPGTSTETRYTHSIVEINGILYIGGGKSNNKIYRFNTKDLTESVYGSWLSPLSPLGYMSNKTLTGNDNKDSHMVKVEEYLWINYANELWVYFP